MINNYTYFELFAGSGAGGYALDQLGFKNVGYSEVDKHAIANYDHNFPNRVNYGDITKIDTSGVPNFDLLIGGSPCQNISMMRQQDESEEGLKGSESKLFFEYVRILDDKLPKWFIFENVRNLVNTNKGKDLETVLELLGKNYNIKYKVLNTRDYGLPQTRRRIYIVGQRKDLGEFNYEFPKETVLTSTAQDLLDKQVDDKYYLAKKMYDYVMAEGTKNFKSKPETDLEIARPLTASMYKMHRAGTDNYYHTEYKPKDKTNLRRPTPREAARFQGIPDAYEIVVSDTQAYKLFGNGMSVNVVKMVAEELIKNTL